MELDLCRRLGGGGWEGVGGKGRLNVEVSWKGVKGWIREGRLKEVGRLKEEGR